MALRLQPGDPVWWRARGRVHLGRVLDMRYQAGQVIRVTVYGYRGPVSMSYRRLHRVHPLDQVEQLDFEETRVAPGRANPWPLPPQRPRLAVAPMSPEQLSIAGPMGSPSPSKEPHG